MPKGMLFGVLSVGAFLSALLLALLLTAPASIVSFVSFVLLMLVVLGPFLAGEELYDFFDKWLDPRVMPDKKIAVTHHVLIGAVFATIFIWFWPVLVMAIESVTELKTGTWTRYLIPHAHMLTITFPYPSWAWSWGFLAAGFFFAGYMLELGYLYFSRPHPKKVRFQ